MTKKMGWRLRSSAEAMQGNRDYMEDITSVEFERVSTSKGDFETASYAVYDGHGGPEASFFAKDHLMEHIKKEDDFYSTDVETVKKAIRSGFLSCHEAMAEKRAEWPKRKHGCYLSNAGTTVALVIIRGDIMYVAHAGDSAVIMATQKDENAPLETMLLTEDHKPESPQERSRIERSGGSVVKSKSIYRVVWERLNNPGTPFEWTEKMPYLSIARSLGDFWSWNKQSQKYLISPFPDVQVLELEKASPRYIILATDGVTNAMGARDMVKIVADFEQKKKRGEVDKGTPANALVGKAISLWSDHHKRADNCSAVVVDLVKKQIEPEEVEEGYIENWVCTENNSLLRNQEVDEQLKTPAKRMASDNNDLVSPPSKKSKTPVKSMPRRSLRLALKNCDDLLTRSAERKRSSL